MTPEARSSDVVRQVTVLVGSLLAVVAAFVGSGAGGQSQSEVGDGALAADATPVAPGEPAFAIWSVIYTGLVAYALWQALPARRADARQRTVGWLVLATMVLNAVWIAVVQAGALGASVPVIVALLAALVVTMARLRSTAPRSLVESVVLDGTIGLYLGWVTVATVANAFAVAVAGGAPAETSPADVWAVGALAAAGAAGVAYAFWTQGRLAIGAAIAWGLAWVVVARTTGTLLSTPAAVAAGVAAGVVVLGTVGARLASRADSDRPGPG